MPMLDAVHRYIAALNAHDVPAIADAMSPSGEYLDPNLDSPIGQQATGEYMKSFLDRFPDAHWDIVTLATSETDAALEWRLTGTFKPNGKPVVATGGDFFTYDPETDRLSSIRGYFDVLSGRKQMEG
jgi:limonene-1,2-epoxide hydrolase